MAPSVDFQTVRLSTDVSLHYGQQGPAAGPAVVFVHGYSDSWFSFSRVLPLLPSGVRAIVPDLRGHGASERPEDGYTVEAMAADVVALMEALAVPRAVLVGHSMGSFVARRVADVAGDRVTGLVLIGSAASAANATVRGVREVVEQLTDPVDPDFVREFQMSTVVRPVPPDFLARVIETSRAMPVRVWKAALDGLMAFASSAPPRSPTVVAGGTQDGVFSAAEQESLARGIPGARLELVEGVGHALHWEDPERCVAILHPLLRA